MAEALKKDDFLRFQVEALDYLYDLPIANDSLFIADVHSPNDNLSTARYRATKVTVNTPKFTYEADPIRRQSFLTKTDFSDSVTVEWIEDAYDSIQKWTLYLMSKKYNFANGLFKVGGGASMHYSMDLYKFAYIEGNDSATNPMDSVALPTCTTVISLTDLEPESIGELTADSNAGSSVKTIPVTYHVSGVSVTNLGDARTMYNDNDFFGGGNELVLL